MPKRGKFYSTIYGEVEFEKIRKDSDYPIVLITKHGNNCDVLSDGKHYGQYDGECTLFPSKDQRDWSKFTAPWYKKEKFDPKTLKEFDKVIVNDTTYHNWKCDIFSHIIESVTHYPYQCVGNFYMFCIPYNDETKHLIGTRDKAPDYYRYWEE